MGEVYTIVATEGIYLNYAYLHPSVVWLSCYAEATTGNNKYVFSVYGDVSLNRKKIAFELEQKILGLYYFAEVIVRPYTPVITDLLWGVKFEVLKCPRQMPHNKFHNTDDMAEQFFKKYPYFALNVGQMMCSEYRTRFSACREKKIAYLVVRELEVHGSNDGPLPQLCFGMVIKRTHISFCSKANSGIILNGNNEIENKSTIINDLERNNHSEHYNLYR